MTCIDGEDGDCNGLITSSFFILLRFGEGLICNGGGIRNIPPLVEFPLRALLLSTEFTDLPSSQTGVLITSFRASNLSVNDDFLLGCGRVNGFLIGNANKIFFLSSVPGALGRRGTGDGRRGFEKWGRGLDWIGVDFGVRRFGGIDPGVDVTGFLSISSLRVGVEAVC